MISFEEEVRQAIYAVLTADAAADNEQRVFSNELLYKPLTERIYNAVALFIPGLTQSDEGFDRPQIDILKLEKIEGTSTEHTID